MREGSETEPSPAPDAHSDCWIPPEAWANTPSLCYILLSLAPHQSSFYLHALKRKRASDQVFSWDNYILHIASNITSWSSAPQELSPSTLAREGHHFHQSTFGQEALSSWHLCGHFQSHWSWSNLGMSQSQPLRSLETISASASWVPASQKAQPSKCHWGISGEETQTHSSLSPVLINFHDMRGLAGPLNLLSPQTRSPHCNISPPALQLFPLWPSQRLLATEVRLHHGRNSSMGNSPGVVKPKEVLGEGRLGHCPTLSLSTVFWEVLEAMEMVSGWLLPSPWLSTSSTPSLQEEEKNNRGGGGGNNCGFRAHRISSWSGRAEP